MEGHKAKMRAYEQKKEQLTKDLTESNANIAKFTPQEMCKLVSAKSSDVYKESEKVRKQYSKNEISIDDFIKTYMD